MAEKYIRDRRNPVNLTGDHMRKTSLTIQHDALTVQELFELYCNGASEMEKLISVKRAEYDGENPQFEDYVPDLDAVQAYEAAWDLANKPKFDNHEVLEDSGKSPDGPESPSGDSGSDQE